MVWKCRDQENFNLPLLMNKYVREMPRPLNRDIPSRFVDIQLGAVPYHRKKLFKKCMPGKHENNLIFPHCSVDHLCNLTFVHPCVGIQVFRCFTFFELSISSLWSCKNMSLPRGVPYPPKLLGRDALGLYPCSCVDALENASPFKKWLFGVGSNLFRKFKGVHLNNLCCIYQLAW